MTKAKVQPLLPVDPYHLIGIGRNHPAASPTIPDRPTFFSKSRSALCASGTDIILPAFATSVIAEAELAVVVGKRLSRASVAEAAAGIAGCLLANDITALPIDPWHLFESKAADGFAPIGPTILQNLDIDDLTLSVEVNGTVTASGSTRELFLSPAEVLSALSRTLTLLPGDVVLTGATAISAPLYPGDMVAVTIADIARIENRIVSEAANS